LKFTHKKIMYTSNNTPDNAALRQSADNDDASVFRGISRREFIKTGSLVFTGLATAKMGFSFIPDNFYESGTTNFTVPYRKPPRTITEVVPGFLWADAGDFQDYGGWAFDTQHFGFMGSSYLIAHGAGRPVKPARLTLPNVTPGRYRLWVRCRDWFPAHSPGQFAVAIDGRDVGQVFGRAADDNWNWQDAGVQELADGERTIELRDLSGFFGRCSSILLTRDLNYTPPAEMADFRAERARFTGHSNKMVTKPEFDVVIVGAGTAGTCAAIAAARMGVRTALITDRPLLGGNASVEIGVPIQGAAQFHRAARETGIIEEAGRIGFARDWGNARVMSRQFAYLAEAEKNLEIFTDLFIDGVEKDGDNRIRAALARNVLTGEPFRFPGKLFIDTSGDSWLGYHAGADYRFGREARHEFNESHAPEKADNITMSGCLRGPNEDFKRCIFLRTAQLDRPVKFDPPPWIYQDMPPFDQWRRGRGYDNQMAGVARAGTWWIEHPNDIDDLLEPEKARDELIRTMYTFWNMVKNEWGEAARIANYDLVYVPFVVGKRETRRLIGDHMLNQNEVAGPVHFEDAIGHSGWNLDIHHPDGIRSTEGPFDFHDILPISEIPYRSLYSRNIENLMMAGRNASVTHVAMGTTRVQGQTCVMGQAAGVAAAMAILANTTPRGIGQNHIRKLQQTLLKQDVYIPGVVNEDTEDLARSAKATASSYLEGEVINPFRAEKTEEESEWSSPNPVGDADWLALNLRRGVTLPWQAGTPLKKISMRLRSAEGGNLTVSLLGLQAAGQMDGAETLATVSQQIPAGTEDWVDVVLSATPATNYLAIVAQSGASIQWAREHARVDGVARLYQQGNKVNVIENSAMAFDVSPPLPFPRLAPSLPELVINGTSRPVYSTPFSSIQPHFWQRLPKWVEDGVKFNYNAWQSAAGQRLPQWIELSWDEPQQIGAVQCVFDTDLDNPLAKPVDAFPRVCVRGYRIECEVNGKWQQVVAERLNFQRFRQHSFAPVQTKKLRLTVESTHGVSFARVFEIRAYKEAKPLVG
jgi:hypothetical protein